MTNPSPTLKRYRLRFSIRTLAIVVTLVCCYAACWVPTKRNGTQQVSDRFAVTSTAIAPLIIATENDGIVIDHFDDGSWRGWGDNRRRYYFWFFGQIAKLPYEREISDPLQWSAWSADSRLKLPSSPPGSGPESQ